MTTGLVLIAAILVLGGVIATVGDRLGMRVGKARLSLFKLRPRQTATVITVLTGVIISATTFGILFAIDDQLRTGVFELREIQDDLESARADLAQAEEDKQDIQTDLRQARAEQRTAQQRLERINASLSEALELQNQTEAQLEATRTRARQVEANYQEAQMLLQRISQQTASLRAEIQQLQEERQALIAQRDRELAIRDQAIAEREAQLRQLEQQRASLEQEVAILEREFQGLRQGSIAILRNQPLAAQVLSIDSPAEAPQQIDMLLRLANRNAIQRILTGTTTINRQIIQVSRTQVEELVNQLRDGEDYVVRVLSAGNYVVGEPCVLEGNPCINVYLSAAVNEIIFQAGEVIASASIDPSTLNDEELVDRFTLLLAAAQFRIRQEGAIAEILQVADGQGETVLNFFEQLQAYNEPIDIRAIASDVTYTAGPIRLDLVAVLNGQVLFTTANP
jgi:uncharacterized protein (DUF3084 family)